MKRIAIFLLLLGALMQSSAITPENDSPFYIYRNDGAFDAFLRSRVDSITFSKTGLDGEEFEYFVVQEIWSKGEATRVPIASIENVGFVQPEVIVSNDLFPLTAAHDAYITAADTLHFTMHADSPAALRPHRGNVVMAEAECQSFANGILARVKQIDYDTDGNYVYTCEAASLDDVYDQIVFYSEGEAAEEVNAQNGPRRISKEFSKEIWDKTFEGTIDRLGGTHYYANDKASCDIKICKTLGTPLYASITLNNAFTGNVGLNFSAERDYAPDPVQIGPTLKVGRITFPHPLLANLIWLEPQIKFMGYFKAHGELDVNFAAHLNRTDAVTLTYSNKAWSIAHAPTMDAAVDTANLSMRGYVEVGLIPEILLALNGSSTGIGISGKVSLKQTLDLKIDALEIYDTSFYEGLKDIQTDTYLGYSTDIFVQSGLFDKDAPRKSYTVLDREKKLFSKYLFPTFGTSYYQKLADDTHLVKVQAERDVICPIKIGMRIYDENDNLVQASLDSLAYNRKTAAQYAFRFTDLDLSHTYYAYPMIYLGPLSLRATPAYSVNKCPVEVDAMNVAYAYYDRSDANNPNTMVYGVHVIAPDGLPDDVTEWGVASGSSLYPISEENEQHVIYFADGAPDTYSSGTGYRIDHDKYIFEMDRSARAYVKRTTAQGREVVMYSDPFTTTLRYDEVPSLTYTDARLESTTLLSNYTNSLGQFVQQFKSVASYTMTLTGTFWLNYINGGVNGDYSLPNNPIWQPTYNGQWRSSFETTYLSTDNIDHSNWHNLHLRSGRTIESDRLNWVSSGGHISTVTITPSVYPAHPNRAPYFTRMPESTSGKNPEQCISMDEIQIHRIDANPVE